MLGIFFAMILAGQPQGVHSREAWLYRGADVIWQPVTDVV